MSLTVDIAKKIGDELGVEWNKMTPEQWFDAMKIELEHKDILKNPNNPTNEDFKTIGKIVFAHLKESYDYYDKLKKMEKTMKESVDLTKQLAKKVGSRLGVNWKVVSLDNFMKAMKKYETIYRAESNSAELDVDDYMKIGKFAKQSINEYRLRQLVSTVIKESLDNPDFYHRLKYEVNKGDEHYELEYNKILGKYGVDSPDQLDEKSREEFYTELDNGLKGHVEPVMEQFNFTKFNQLLKEGKIHRGKLFKEHGIFFTFPEIALLEIAPPGREDQVKKLKQKFPKDVAYKIAWSQSSDAKSKDNPEGEPVGDGDGVGENDKTVLMPPDFETEKKIKEAEVIEPDVKDKDFIKEKDVENEIAFSTGLNSDRYDKTPTGDRFVKAPGQYSDGSETKKGLRSKV